MNFLAPLFLAGAAAITLPILFHLIRRSSREKFSFSSLMFLEPSPPRITKRSRLEHILLLILRATVIGLLALAFARPFLPKAMPAAPAAAEKTRVALLVDASASMRREDLWNQARERAVTLARALKPEDELAVYTFDQQLHTVLNFADAARLLPKDRPVTVESRLKSLNPSWGGTRLGNAMLTATENLLENLNSDAQDQGNSNLRLVIISDLQSGAALDGLQGFEWPKKLRVQLEPVTARELFNAHLQIFDDPQRAFLAASNSVLRARVFNSPEARTEQFQIFWNGPAGLAGNKLEVYVPPGQSRIVALPTRPQDANQLTLTGDAVDLDNQIYSIQPPVHPLTVAYWGESRADDPHAMRYYLHRAFEQSNLVTRVAAVSNAIPKEPLAFYRRESAGQQGASLAFLVLGEGSPEAVALARSVLSEGRSVLLPMRSAADANVISDLAGGVLVSATEAPVKNYALLGKIDYQNPLFAPFSDARYSDFTKIHFWKHRALNLANVTNATVIASFDSGDPALVSIPVEKGHLLVLTSTWMPSDSQLALSTKFVPLLFGMLEQSANLSVRRHHFMIGESIPLPGESKEVTLPDGTEATASDRLFSQTTQPGIYQAGDFQFAVNLDPSESKLTPLQPEDLSSLGIPVGKALETVDPKLVEQRKRHLLATETESRQKLWRWFVVGALGFLLIESWLAGRLSRAQSASPA